MGTTFTQFTCFEIVTCFKCGVAFGMPDTLVRTLRDVGRDQSFWCPNGHSQAFVESRVTQLERTLASVRAAKERAEAEARDKGEQLERAEKRAARVRRRVAAGVCPHCNRTFQALARHMQTKHPKCGA